MTVSHKELLNRVSRLEGQIRGVGKMISEEKYCVEILRQIKASRSALNGLETEIVNRHLKHCVAETFKSESREGADKKIDEIISLLKETSR